MGARTVTLHALPCRLSPPLSLHPCEVSDLPSLNRKKGGGEGRPGSSFEKCRLSYKARSIPVGIMSEVREQQRSCKLVPDKDAEIGREWGGGGGEAGFGGVRKTDTHT